MDTRRLATIIGNAVTDSLDREGYVRTKDAAPQLIEALSRIAAVIAIQGDVGPVKAAEVFGEAVVAEYAAHGLLETGPGAEVGN